ncbi:hypothetical protein BB050_03196 [Flavobacterium anhuiense]|uniref:Uncharacterized protein n=1 Tax=Flavobacterium anhuiense TaxID=459526 RepID=A0AAC9GJ47_9FLAO|nr:hypothetical protein [Flavobacterium anhuiense]AOC96285.1 hypothetical protein BB050_03196 [Flavobacterium anhuiense]
MKHQTLSQKLDQIERKVKNKVYKCIYEDCNEIAIKSHVLQKNGILNSISYNNHLYQVIGNSPFEEQTKGKFQFQKIGINNIYTFPGFCKNHDASIFSSIENTKKMDLKSEKNLCLFAYRSLCQEIRRKEMAFDIASGYLDISTGIKSVVFLSNYKKGILNSLNNLLFFKKEFENELKNNKNRFIYKVCEINRLEICISSPINIIDSENSLSRTNLNGERINPFTTSIINIFPYKDKSYVLIAFHADYICKWSEILFEKIINSDDAQIKKIISDLISTRIEFWCISPELYNTLDEKKKKELFTIWEKEAFNHSWNIENTFNLFQ